MHSELFQKKTTNKQHRLIVVGCWKKKREETQPITNGQHIPRQTHEKNICSKCEREKIDRKNKNVGIRTADSLLNFTIRSRADPAKCKFKQNIHTP